MYDQQNCTGINRANSNETFLLSLVVPSIALCECVRIIKHQSGGLETHAVFAPGSPGSYLRPNQSAWYRPKVAGQFLTHQQTRIYVKYVQLSIQTAGPAPIVL